MRILHKQVETVVAEINCWFIVRLIESLFWLLRCGVWFECRALKIITHSSIILFFWPKSYYVGWFEFLIVSLQLGLLFCLFFFLFQSKPQHFLLAHQLFAKLINRSVLQKKVTSLLVINKKWSGQLAKDIDDGGSNSNSRIFESSMRI